MEHNGRCEKTAKLRFASKADGQRARRERYDSHLLHVYQCVGKQACGDWHIGHGDGRSRRRRPVVRRKGA